MSAKKMKTTEKTTNVREISEAERKMLKDGNIQGKAIDLRFTSKIPPAAMDDIVETVIAPMITSICEICHRFHMSGRYAALNELKDMVMTDCRAKGPDAAKCKKCKDRKACEAKAKEEAPKSEKKPAKGKKAK